MIATMRVRSLMLHPHRRNFVKLGRSPESPGGGSVLSLGHCRSLFMRARIFRRLARLAVNPAE